MRIIYPSNHTQPDIIKPIPRSKTPPVDHLTTERICTIVIRCECNQCKLIESPRFNFTLLDLNLLNSDYIARTAFPNFQVPHIAAYGPITQNELYRAVVKIAYDRGWQCYVTREQFYQYKNGDTGPYYDHHTRYAWIAPEHAQHFGGNQ